jgi:hypothetical protein
MEIFSLLSLLDSLVTPQRTKIHLASFNQIDRPIDVYLAGKFDEWQRFQTKRNFEREFVLSLISLPESNKWLFAGVHKSGEAKANNTGFIYPLVEESSCSELNGRLVVDFVRSGRQSYLNAERWVEQLLVSEIRPERMAIQHFPGYRNVNISREELMLVTTQALDSWRAALSSVAGVYLISDTNSGKLYVGSASGEGGIWQRWNDYANSGHGGNVELKRLSKDVGIKCFETFRYSILEIADIHESPEGIRKRESHWKEVLLSKEFGMNLN